MLGGSNLERYLDQLDPIAGITAGEYHLSWRLRLMYFLEDWAAQSRVVAAFDGKAYRKLPQENSISFPRDGKGGEVI